MLYQQIPVPQAPVSPPPLVLRTLYVVKIWGDFDGAYAWESVSGIPSSQRVSLFSTVSNNTVIIFVDPISAIAMGKVTAEQLGFPEGLLAAFNLLKG
jgi:hypothetical protein